MNGWFCQQHPTETQTATHPIIQRSPKLNQFAPNRRFTYIFAALLLLAVLVSISDCQTSPAATPTRMPPAVTLKIVTLPPSPAVTVEMATLPLPPAVTIEVATLTPTPTTLVPPRTTPETATPVPTAQPPQEAVFSYLHALASGDTPRLFDSYTITDDFDDGDTAWTYDNALVLLAFLARGADEDLAAARTLADALVYAQTHDPDFDDGRLRDAYHANSFIRDDGKANVDRDGSATGNMAWATLALVRAWEQLGDEAYLTAAQRLGQWVFDHTHDTRGAGGYTGGLNASGSPSRWKATEHNADVYAAFMDLHQTTGDPVWRERAMSAKRFLRAMWHEEGGFFWTGTTDDGVTVNPSPIPEDAQSWTLLALGEPERYGQALVWAESTLYDAACPACETVGGYRFSDLGFGCWWEGTAHMALAWQAAGKPDRAKELLQSLRHVRIAVPELAGEAVPAACGIDAVTGYGWDYPAQVPHIGATAWYLFAELEYNPFWGISTTEPMPFAGVYDEAPTTDLPSIAPAPAGFQKGMSYAAWWQGEYQQPWTDDTMQALAATGSNWIAIIVTCYQETHTSVSITCDLPRTPTDADLTHAISQAHTLGLNVMLKPHLDLNNDPAHWRGQIGTGFTTEAEWAAWFDSYQAFVTHYAALAETEGVEQFSVGTELVGTSKREAEWRAVAAAVRNQFSGSLVYASNHGGEETSVTWWDAVDYIGVDAYYPLTAKNDPTLAELEAAWERPIAALEKLHDRYKKQIILTEIGYRSVDGANRQPWEWATPGEVDLQEQADSYRAALGSLWGRPWLAGIYWWNWDTNPEQGGPHDTGFTPHGKPAEEVLKAYYQSGNSLHIPTIPDDVTLTDDAFLDRIQQRAVAYFWQEADPQTGLIKDRASNFGPDDYTVSSTAAVGFGLAALAIGESREWLSYEQAYGRTLTSLRFLHDQMPHEHGFYYHFVDLYTGQRVWNSEVSSIDTAWLLAGVLFAGEYFQGTEVEVLADELYRRVDFQWMLTDGGQRPAERLLNHGWTPQDGFLPYRWDTYSELMLLYLLAIGSPTHPIPDESWEAWARPQATYASYTTFAQGPLFTHQFSQAWVDFRGRRDRLGYDYFQSSVNATLANRQFALDNRDRFSTYDKHVWGLTASDGPDGQYHAYGASPGIAVHDGTVAPSAVAGSIVFTSELSIAALRTMYERYGDRLWGQYGFSNAFNLDQSWWDQDVIGIDLGITLLMIENYRSGLVWHTFMPHPAIQRAMNAVGFVESE